MLYLSGVKGCATTIKQYRPDLSDSECRNLAKKVMELRQGKKTYKNGSVQYHSGSDSEAYNLMIRICNRLPLPAHLSHLSANDTARLPISNASISEAISVDNCGKSEYLTSRANWTIQSTGVDILHLFSIILKDLYDYYDVDGFLVLPIHDELWTCVNENQVEIAAWCFQVAHLYTWAYLAKRLGFTDLPWYYQFFSEVNIDNCLRKEPDMSQYTPSNTQDNIENGYTI
jgi:DNA polymerase gamma 1